MIPVDGMEQGGVDYRQKHDKRVPIMSSDLSPQNEQFIRDAVVSGVFHSRGEALDHAVVLLKRRLALLAHIDEGTRQLHAGQYTDYDEAGLRALFDEIKAEGRKQYEANMGSS